MRIRMKPVIAMMGVTVLLLASAPMAQTPPQQPPQPPQQEHQHPAEKPAGDMAAKCQAMMADHQKMMGDMKAANERLDALVAKMNAASGQAKTDATAAAVTEIVAQRKTMHDMMMKMMHGGMTHTMDHMQAGAQSMAMCPMMKGMGGAKH
jgi:hypothetical protein